MSKGSVPRPLAVPRDQFAAQFDAIFGKRSACDCAAGQCKAQDARSCADWVKRELKGSK